MRKQGVTNDGQIIVEMSEDEYRCMERLAFAVEGKTPGEILAHYERTTVFPDMTTVLGAITAFTMSKAALNELKQIVEHAEATLVKRNEPDPGW